MRKEKPVTSNPINSFAHVLKELENKADKKKSTAASIRINCPICFREIAPKRICGGHSGGGGGSTGTTGSSDEKASQGQPVSCKTKATTDKVTSADNFNPMKEALGFQLQTGDENFNPEIIAQLIASKLLIIDNDRESMTLSIKCQCEPSSLSKEQRHELKKFITSILKVWNEFKKINHLSDDCVNLLHDNEGNILSLRITSPALALYDAFIQRLPNNLFPVSAPEQEIFNPSPFSIKMRL